MKYEKYEHVIPLDVATKMQSNEESGMYDEWYVHANHPDDNNILPAGEYMKEFFRIVREEFI